MRRILVTGGSRGIGEACVRRFAKEGDAVALIYHTAEDAARRVSEETGAVAIRADLRDTAAIPAAVQTALEALGGIDVLINNAGISRSGLLTELTNADWEEICRVNLTAPILLAREVLPGMLRRHEGVIVNIGSMWGKTGSSCEVAYSAVKAGISGFTKALAKEVGPSGIRVNCVEPGVIDTDMNKCYDAETMRALAEETPLCRIGRAEEVAAVVFSLCSEDASFLTGQIIGVDGGFAV